MALSENARLFMISAMANQAVADELAAAVDASTQKLPSAGLAAASAAIPVLASGAYPFTVAAATAETNTLAIPTFVGQTISLWVDTLGGGGTRAVTAAAAINQAGNTVMTFGAARDFIKLEAITVGGALRWQVVANDGVALS